jgi:ABC-type Fe3+-hydroxamate transport system substrate-binding protein
LLPAFVLALACEPSAPAPPPEPPRIVSVGAELAALLAEMGLGPAVVGVDSRSFAIPELAHALDLGDPDAPSVELARSVRPELVLVLAAPSGPGADFAEALEAEGIPAYLLAPRDANGVIATIHRVGRLVGRELRAASIAARLTRQVSEIATLRDGRSRLTAAWVLEGDPLVVVGASGLLHELLELAGAENAFHTPQRERLTITSAELVASAPDVVLAPVPSVPVPPGARRIVIDPTLAALPLLDVPGRVRAVHVALYPSATVPGSSGETRPSRGQAKLLSSR